MALAIGAVSFTMAVLGLCLSALVTCTEQTMPALVGLVMIQLVLCGALVPVAGRPLLEQIAWLAPARWAYAAIASTMGLVRAKKGDEDQDWIALAGADHYLMDMLMLGLLCAAAVGVAWRWSDAAPPPTEAARRNDPRTTLVGPGDAHAARPVRPRPGPGPHRPGRRGDALRATLALARTADELGYHRYWLAEHHNMPAVAATNPPVLIGLVAGATERIRVGSGGVMLPNHAPLVVAEQFALLEAAFPGPDRPRHRPGAGHRPGHQLRAAPRRRRGRATRRSTRFPEYVDNVLAMMEPDGVGLDRRAGAPTRCRRRPAARSVPTIWLLGSSDYSARLAAEKGLPYVFAHHFSGSGTAEALELYRSAFRPSPELAEPRTFLTVNAVGRGDRRGGRAARAARSCRRCWRCAPAPPLAPAAAGRGGREGRAARRRTRDLVDAMRRALGDRRPRPRPAAELAELAATYGVDEVMVHPVAGAYAGTDPDRSPAREETLRLLAGARRPISVSRPFPTKLACRPNVGLFRGASRLPGTPLESLAERFGVRPGMRFTERLHEVHRLTHRRAGTVRRADGRR